MRGLLHHEDWSWSNAPRFGGGGGGSTNTIQSTTPWAGQQPALGDIYNNAQNLYHGTPPQYYPGQTYAPLTGQQNYLIGQATSLGANFGDGGLNAANTDLTNTLSPNYTSDTSGAFGQGQGVLSNELETQ